MYPQPLSLYSVVCIKKITLMIMQLYDSLVSSSDSQTEMCCSLQASKEKPVANLWAWTPAAAPSFLPNMAGDWFEMTAAGQKKSPEHKQHTSPTVARPPAARHAAQRKSSLTFFLAPPMQQQQYQQPYSSLLHPCWKLTCHP